MHGGMRSRIRALTRPSSGAGHTLDSLTFAGFGARATLTREFDAVVRDHLAAILGKLPWWETPIWHTSFLDACDKLRSR